MDAIADLADRYSLRRDPRRPRAESRAAACRAARPAGAVARARCDRPRHARMSGWSPTSSPVPGSTIAASPMRARSRSRRKSPGASATSTLARDLGRLHINISGCINACGHHHVGHIGILGVEKNGEEFYQITLGGTRRRERPARRADRSGGALRARSPTWSRTSSPPISSCASGRRRLFIETVKRTGVEPFKERVYATR